MRDTDGRNADKVGEAHEYAEDKSVDLRAIELDVGSGQSVDAAVARIIGEHGRIDVVMHNAGHMAYGPSEAFTSEQLAQLYDVNVLSTQRVNRAVLPHMRSTKSGLLVWNSSSSVAGGTPPYLGPYFAAKAGMDALAVIYARELALWGIETAILVPGAFTKGTNHFANAGEPADQERARDYADGPYKGYAENRCKPRSPTSCRTTLTRRSSRAPSSRSWPRPKANVRSAPSSIRRRTVRPSASPSPTDCARRCCTEQVWRS